MLPKFSLKRFWYDENINVFLNFFQVGDLKFAIRLLFSFQIASSAKGRGVLRLLLIQHQINLLCIPTLCLELLILAYPLRYMPGLLCISLEILVHIVTTNRTVFNLAVASGRYKYNHELLESVNLDLCFIFSGYFTSIKILCHHTSRKKAFSSASHGFILWYLERLYLCCLVRTFLTLINPHHWYGTALAPRHQFFGKNLMDQFSMQWLD